MDTKPTLTYTASRIALAERELKMNFFDELPLLARKPSMSGLLFLFKAGGGTDTQFDECFKKGADEVMVVIMEGLEAGGFLPKEAVDEVKKAMAEIKESQETLQTSGEATKKQRLRLDSILENTGI